MKTYLIAGKPLELVYHNITRKSKCEGLKSYKIG